MGWIKEIKRPVQKEKFHRCNLPYLYRGYTTAVCPWEEGSIWRCDKCQKTYRLGVANYLTLNWTEWSEGN